MTPTNRDDPSYELDIYWQQERNTSSSFDYQTVDGIEVNYFGDPPTIAAWEEGETTYVLAASSETADGAQLRDAVERLVIDFISGR